MEQGGIGASLAHQGSLEKGGIKQNVESPVKWLMTLTFVGGVSPEVLVGEGHRLRNPTRSSFSCNAEPKLEFQTNMSLLSSPTLPNRYVRPSHRSSSNDTAETNDEWP